MDRGKLAKIRAEMESARRSPRRAADLEAIAKRLGRAMKKRGKEPTWESEVFDHLNPLSIPRHGGKDLAPGTQRSILIQLEDDLNAWDEKLDDGN